MNGRTEPRTVQRSRHALTVHGVVQGVGFRPFVYVLARELGLSGVVSNNSDGVHIEVEGDPEALATFARRVADNAPPMARVDEVIVTDVPPAGGTDFVIEASQAGAGRTLVSPDIATCDDCLAEMADPDDHRYRHAFISCTNCGPRFTVITGLPYDRPATTMASLPLCDRCAAEYADPANRRFHAQTVACPDCGPRLNLTRPDQPTVVRDAAALAETRALLSSGAIVAVKGLGGYHLACDATDENAVAALRKRKDRGDKPFAVMVRDLAAAEAIAVLSPDERALLVDIRRPVVLVPSRPDTSASLRLAPSVAPGSFDVGIMVAYTPLHHLLFGLPGDPPGPRVLVMTSGNVSGEPIVIDDEQARLRLAGLADAWLAHDRPIHVPCDDSVVRVAAGKQLPVRRSRGYAPMPVALPVQVRPALAVGGDLKNTFCVGDGSLAWLSGHVGDMDDVATLAAFETATEHLSALTSVVPGELVSDRHPAYRSAAWATRTAKDRPVARVQHHHAHIASAMAENGHDGSRKVIGFAFDGTGYGDDGAVWGGEVLLADYNGFLRAGHLKYVSLPGGDSGVRNPCRMALSHLHAAGVDWDPRLPSVSACSSTEQTVLAHQLETGLRCAPTSSMGRLVDAVSSIAGVCQRTVYEAEAAMRFEAIARDAIDACDMPYAFEIVEGEPVLVDAAPVIAAAARDAITGVPAAVIAARFHLGVVNVVIDLATRLSAATGLREVALSGGVFLNVLLTTRCVEGLSERGFRVLHHTLVPPSDAGLALGQLVLAAHL